MHQVLHDFTGKKTTTPQFQVFISQYFIKTKYFQIQTIKLCQQPLLTNKPFSVENTMLM